MGWSWTTAMIGDDWQDAAFIGELYEAWNERRIAIGQAAVAVPAAGDEASDVALFADLQQWIETYCTSFAQSHETDGTPRAAAYWDGSTGVPTAAAWNWTLTKLRSAAGLNSSGFKRLTGAGTSYGIAQAGDYVALDLYNELKACLSRLAWTYQAANYVNNATTYKLVYGTTFAAALSNYASASPATTTTLPHIAVAYSKRDGASSYELYRHQSYYAVTLTTAVPCAIDWYHWAGKLDASGTFDDHGDGYTEDAVAHFSTSASSSGPYPRSSPTVGNTASGASFTDPGSVSPYRTGYALWPYALMRWDFAYA